MSFGARGAAGFAECDRQRFGDFGGDVFLQLESVVERAVVAVRPEHDAALGFSEVRRNADAVFGAAYGAVEHVGGVEGFGGFGFVAAAEGEARRGAEHAQTLQA